MKLRHAAALALVGWAATHKGRCSILGCAPNRLVPSEIGESLERSGNEFV